MDDLLSFKADSVRDAAADLRRTMNEAGRSGVALGLNGFAPPWSHVTGMEYASVHQVVQATRCKLFTFHWPMIVRWWSETLLAWNPGLDEQAVCAPSRPRSISRRHPTSIGGRSPSTACPAPTSPTRSRWRRSRARSTRPSGWPAGRTGESCLAYVHSYRPAAEFGRVLEAVLASEARAAGSSATAT